MKPFSINVFASQVLNPDSDTNKEKECSAARTCFACWTHHSGREVQVRWRMNERLRPIQGFSDHRTKFIFQNYLETDLYDMAKSIPCIHLPNLFYSLLNDSDYTAVLMHETCIWAVPIARSTNPQPDGGFARFVRRPFEAREVGRY